MKRSTMGLELVIVWFWVLQIGLAIALLVWAVVYEFRWAAAGVVGGLIVGFAPLLIGPAGLLGSGILIVIVATIALIFIYATRRSWILLSVVLTVLGIPLSYMLIRGWLFQIPIPEFSIAYFFLSPLVSAVALMEIFRSRDIVVARRRSA